MFTKLFAGVVAAVAVLGSACGPSQPKPDGGNPNDAGTSLNETFDPGFTATSPNKPGSIQVTFSGETFGENGLPFQPANAGDPAFVDGWSLTIDEFLIVVGNVRLTANATQYQDWKQLNGVVAVKAGPFVLDAHKPKGFVGADGVEPAGGMFKWDAQDNGQAFDTSARYAFSYDTVPAKYPATEVNLSKAQFPDYDKMVQHGWTKYLVGTATYVATGTHPDAAAQGKFAALPKTIHFTMGWSDAGGLLNCVNPDLGSGSDPGADLANRGIQTNTNGAVNAQITIHVDHLFWDKLKQEGTPLRFDPIAAWAPADTTTTPLALDSLNKPLSATFSDGTPLPDRAPYQNVPGGYTSDQSNPNQVLLDLNGVPSTSVKNLADFLAFSAQSQMHLNADGLCYVFGQNASDPFYAPGLPK